MVEGLLWYDGTTKSLEEKIEASARRYYQKFGRWPNRCYVNPKNTDKPDLSLSFDGYEIRVTAAPNILLHHYWTGEYDHTDLPHRDRESDSCRDNKGGETG